MNCTDFERSCHDRLDARRSLASDTDRELIEHASACASCHALWERFQTLERGLRSWERPPGPSSGFVDRVLAHRDDAGRVLKVEFAAFLPRAARWAAAAAAVLLVGAIGWRLDRTRRNEVRPPVEPTLTRNIEAARPLSDVLSEATASGLALARETSAPAARVGRRVIETTSLSNPAVDLFVPTPSASDVFQSVGDRVGRGVRPISGTARRAFGFLLGTNPDEVKGAGGDARGA